jgi:hypothetical protein
LSVESEDKINESKVSDTKKNQIESAHVMLQHTASLGTCSLDISLELNDLFTLKLKEQFQFITDSWIFGFSKSVETQTHLSSFSEEHDKYQKQDNPLFENSKRSHNSK